MFCLMFLAFYKAMPYSVKFSEIVVWVWLGLCKIALCTLSSVKRFVNLGVVCRCAIQDELLLKFVSRRRWGLCVHVSSPSKCIRN